MRALQGAMQITLCVVLHRLAVTLSKKCVVSSYRTLSIGAMLSTCRYFLGALIFSPIFIRYPPCQWVTLNRSPSHQVLSILDDSRRADAPGRPLSAQSHVAWDHVRGRSSSGRTDNRNSTNSRRSGNAKQETVHRSSKSAARWDKGRCRRWQQFDLMCPVQSTSTGHFKIIAQKTPPSTCRLHGLQEVRAQHSGLIVGTWCVKILCTSVYL